ncbi:MAG TPA: metalloregulator ArsR/SmtB family transcription factor [Thermodesulfobacteriota bacterium]
MAYAYIGIQAYKLGIGIYKMIHADIFKSLGDETRLRIVNLLLACDSLCVCEMVDTLKIPQYQISKHLMILKNSGVVDVRRRGTWSYYCLKRDGGLNKMLFSFLKKFLNSEDLEKDKSNLEFRLLIREEGKCVVGFVAQKELSRMIDNKRRILLKT